jgi:hypothetical protein
MRIATATEIATLLKGNCSHHATAIAKVAPKAKAKVSATVNRFANLFIANHQAAGVPRIPILAGRPLS